MSFLVVKPNNPGRPNPYSPHSFHDVDPRTPMVWLDRQPSFSSLSLAGSSSVLDLSIVQPGEKKVNYLNLNEKFLVKKKTLAPVAVRDRNVHSHHSTSLSATSAFSGHSGSTQSILIAPFNHPSITSIPSVSNYSLEQVNFDEKRGVADSPFLGSNDSYFSQNSCSPCLDSPMYVMNKFLPNSANNNSNNNQLFGGEVEGDGLDNNSKERFLSGDQQEPTDSEVSEKKIEAVDNPQNIGFQPITHESPFENHQDPSGKVAGLANCHNSVSSSSIPSFSSHLSSSTPQIARHTPGSPYISAPSPVHPPPDTIAPAYATALPTTILPMRGKKLTKKWHTPSSWNFQAGLRNPHQIGLGRYHPMLANPLPSSSLLSSSNVIDHSHCSAPTSEVSSLYSGSQGLQPSILPPFPKPLSPAAGTNRPPSHSQEEAKGVSTKAAPSHAMMGSSSNRKGQGGLISSSNSTALTDQLTGDDISDAGSLLSCEPEDDEEFPDMNHLKEEETEATKEILNRMKHGKTSTTSPEIFLSLNMGSSNPPSNNRLQDPNNNNNNNNSSSSSSSNNNNNNSNSNNYRNNPRNSNMAMAMATSEDVVETYPTTTRSSDNVSHTSDNNPPTVSTGISTPSFTTLDRNDTASLPGYPITNPLGLHARTGGPPAYRLELQVPGMEGGNDDVGIGGAKSQANSSPNPNPNPSQQSSPTTPVRSYPNSPIPLSPSSHSTISPEVVLPFPMAQSPPAFLTPLHLSVPSSSSARPPPPLPERYRGLAQQPFYPATTAAGDPFASFHAHTSSTTSSAYPAMVPLTSTGSSSSSNYYNQPIFADASFFSTSSHPLNTSSAGEFHRSASLPSLSVHGRTVKTFPAPSVSTTSASTSSPPRSPPLLAPSVSQENTTLGHSNSFLYYMDPNEEGMGVRTTSSTTYATEAASASASSSSSSLPFQVHRRLMGWKLTTPQRRKDLLSLLDLVHHPRSEEQKSESLMNKTLSYPGKSISKSLLPQGPVPPAYRRLGHDLIAEGVVPAAYFTSDSLYYFYPEATLSHFSTCEEEEEGEEEGEGEAGEIFLKGDRKNTSMYSSYPSLLPQEEASPKDSQGMKERSGSEPENVYHETAMAAMRIDSFEDTSMPSSKPSSLKRSHMKAMKEASESLQHIYHPFHVPLEQKSRQLKAWEDSVCRLVRARERTPKEKMEAQIRMKENRELRMQRHAKKEAAILAKEEEAARLKNAKLGSTASSLGEAELNELTSSSFMKDIPAHVRHLASPPRTADSSSSKKGPTLNATMLNYHKNNSDPSKESWTNRLHEQDRQDLLRQATSLAPRPQLDRNVFRDTSEVVSAPPSLMASLREESKEEKQLRVRRKHWYGTDRLLN